MQENYEDGTKGEIKLVAWNDLIEEIKKSLLKKEVKSVTISKTAGFSAEKIIRFEEEKKNLIEEILKS